MASASTVSWPSSRSVTRPTRSSGPSLRTRRSSSPATWEVRFPPPVDSPHPASLSCCRRLRPPSTGTATMANEATICPGGHCGGGPMTATQPRSKKVQQGRRPAAPDGPVDSRRTRSSPPGRSPHHGLSYPVRCHLVLTALGAVMVLSASAASSIAETESAWSLFQRQLMWVRSERS